MVKTKMTSYSKLSYGNAALGKKLQYFDKKIKQNYYIPDFCQIVLTSIVSRKHKQTLN